MTEDNKKLDDIILTILSKKGLIFKQLLEEVRKHVTVSKQTFVSHSNKLKNQDLISKKEDGRSVTYSLTTRGQKFLKYKASLIGMNKKSNDAYEKEEEKREQLYQLLLYVAVRHPAEHRFRKR